MDNKEDIHFLRLLAVLLNLSLIVINCDPGKCSVFLKVLNLIEIKD